MGKEWINYVAPGGRDKVKDDITQLKLTRFEAERVREHMIAQARGELSYPTVKPLVGYPGLFEIRIKADRRSFRLVFAEVNGGLVLLALSFFRKQANSQPKDLNLAQKRHREWQASHGPDDAP